LVSQGYAGGYVIFLVTLEAHFCHSKLLRWTSAISTKLAVNF
jgi:hypothetical protein